MVEEHIEEYGQDAELQQKIVSSTTWAGDTFSWEVEKELKIIIKLLSGKERESMEKLSVKSTHKAYIKKNELSELDYDKKIVINSKSYYIRYIEIKNSNYPALVNHDKIYLEYTENER